MIRERIGKLIRVLIGVCLLVVVMAMIYEIYPNLRIVFYAAQTIVICTVCTELVFVAYWKWVGQYLSQDQIDARVRGIAREHLERMYGFPFEECKRFFDNVPPFDLVGEKDNHLVLGVISDAKFVASQFVMLGNMVRYIPHKQVDWIVVIPENQLMAALHEGIRMQDMVAQMLVGPALRVIVIDHRDCNIRCLA